jgi:hypothetical protein
MSSAKATNPADQLNLSDIISKTINAIPVITPHMRFGNRDSRSAAGDKHQ